MSGAAGALERSMRFLADTSEVSWFGSRAFFGSLGDNLTIFDIEKNDLLGLSDVLLEELIARLAEAEVAKLGHSPASVSWSGPIKAPDDGIDIHVQVKTPELDTGFLSRADTILQSKKNSMPKNAIESEMLRDGELKPTISNQAKIGGSYVIVSLADDCSPRMKKDRIAAMRAAVASDPNKDSLHLEFFDRSKLAQWVRQHPPVLLWVKIKLGQGYSGWQPYGAWSNPPKGSPDTLISAPGVTVHLPTEQGRKLSIEEAMEPIRNLVRTSSKAIRITGLSGVGKTRIVQALFDETVGENALDKTIAIYVDTGHDPDPSASAMLDRLISEGRRAVMILDNCPSELHSILASKLHASRGEVRLITVEYDIRNDKPQITEVIHIEADGPEVAEELLLRRFPAIGQGNARRAARFADGNARVALAIAEQVEQGESLAALSDGELFDRLFKQRRVEDGDLREMAETLSLVYSFSVLDPEVGKNELEVLGGISGHSKPQLFRAAAKLAERHIVQKRAHWRAILPHAIANRLARSALEGVPLDALRAAFEAPGNNRLLMSFAHRLGLMHDHPVAREIVEEWLQPGGLLGRIGELDDNGSRILEYVGPVAPAALLDRIEAEITAPDFKGMDPKYNPRRTTILNLLRSLAYDQNAFERCMTLMIRIADFEDKDNNYDSIRDKVSGFFQPYLSGTHASLKQRLFVVQECLCSKDTVRCALGAELLGRALSGPPWMGFGLNEFGARPRDYGYRPNHHQLVEWRTAFLELAVRQANSNVSVSKDNVRAVLARAFRSLWQHEAMWGKLDEAARAIHEHQPWGEGWKAIRSTIAFDYKGQGNGPRTKPLPKLLADLSRDLEPKELIPKINTYVLGCSDNYEALDDEFDVGSAKKYKDAANRLSMKAIELGEIFAASGCRLNELGSAVFSPEWMANRRAFGIGLAKGASDINEYWRELIVYLSCFCGSSCDVSLIGGFIEGVSKIDLKLSQDLLDECADNPQLQAALVWLHPPEDFTETDLDRCLNILGNDNVNPSMFGQIIWRDDYAHLPPDRLLELSQKLLDQPHGDEVLLEALCMKLHGKDPSEDTLGQELRKLGLKAAVKLILGERTDAGITLDYKIETVVAAALSHFGNDQEKSEWINAIFSFVDNQYGYAHPFEGAIATTAGLMPDRFLDTLMSGCKEKRDQRMFFIRNEPIDHHPLSRVNVADLISWCRKQKELDAWSIAASGIDLWRESENNSAAISITSAARELLEAASEPEPVLRAFKDRVRPSAWSGSCADMMQGRADALGELVKHSRPAIATAVKAEMERLAKEIHRERESEKRRDEEREQRFE